MSRPTAERSCHGKRQLGSKQEAKRVIKAMVSSKGGSRKVLNAYECEHCGFWHVGHKLGWRGWLKGAEARPKARPRPHKRPASDRWLEDENEEGT